MIEITLYASVLVVLKRADYHSHSVHIYLIGIRNEITRRDCRFDGSETR